MDLARELAVALEDPDTGQCHACGAVLTHERLLRSLNRIDLPPSERLDNRVL